MQKILLVDDEVYAREAIEESIPWLEYDIETVSASNGIEALEILKNNDIDVMLTDIKMPGMTGLELLAEVQKLALNIEVIILSSYNEFDLVRQAMKLGSSDYLFKPTMLPKDIMEAILKAAKKQSEKKAVYKSLQTRSEEYNLLKEKEAFFQKLINGEKILADKMNKQFEKYQIPKHILWNSAVVFKLIKYQESMVEIFQYDIHLLKASVSNILNEAFESSPNYQLISYNFNEYIIILWDTKAEADYKYNLEQTVVKTIDFLKTYYKLYLVAGVSNFDHDMCSISNLYLEAAAEAEKADMDYQVILFADSFARNTALKGEVSKAIEYIKKNLCDPNLTLQTAADYIGVSKNYFSKIFKEAMGVNFIDYITRLRVEKARNLYIHTDMKIYEIAEKVGYSDWHYLYSVYRKVLGHSMSKERGRIS